MYLCYLIAMNDKSWLVQGSAAVCTAPAAVLYLLIWKHLVSQPIWTFKARSYTAANTTLPCEQGQ